MHLTQTIVYSMHFILIETYWNVNVENNNAHKGLTYINRDILECKCGFDRHPCVLPCILIETYWNVNTFTGAMINSADMNINRITMECK